MVAGCGTQGDTTELRVAVAPGLSITLLEAGYAMQEALVDAALEADSCAPEQDPYGVVLWPAAQVVSREIARMAPAGMGSADSLKGQRFVELGAGTGLCSLTAALLGAEVLATDYRDEPLELLRSSAARTSDDHRLSLAIECRRFDILDSSMPLPAGDVLVAADLLYLKSTSEALASRCLEALGSGFREVLVGDSGRPGRPAFLEALRSGGIVAEFESIHGWGAVSSRHDLISSAALGAETTVGLLRLKP